MSRLNDLYRLVGSLEETRRAADGIIDGAPFYEFLDHVNDAIAVADDEIEKLERDGEP